MKKRILALCLSASVAFCGCAARVKNVTNLPPGVTLKQAQNWDAAIADLHKVATTVSTVRQTLTDLHNATYDGKPLLTDEYYADALRALAHVDQLELAAESVLRQSPQNFSLSAKATVDAYIQQVSVEIEHLISQGAVGIKNPQSQQSVNNLLTEVAAAVNLLLSL
jgi:hypothetical protein